MASVIGGYILPARAVIKLNMDIGDGTRRIPFDLPGGVFRIPGLT